MPSQRRNGLVGLTKQQRRRLARSGAPVGTLRSIGAPTDDGKEGVVQMWLELRSIAAGTGSTLAKPGSGGTGARLATLADWAERDLSLARLVEGHVAALATLYA